MWGEIHYILRCLISVVFIRSSIHKIKRLLYFIHTDV